MSKIKAALILIFSTVIISSLITASAVTGSLALLPVGTQNEQIRKAQSVPATPTPPATSTPSPKPIHCAPGWRPVQPPDTGCEPIIKKEISPKPICPTENSCNPDIGTIYSGGEGGKGGDGCKVGPLTKVCEFSFPGPTKQGNNHECKTAKHPGALPQICLSTRKHLPRASNPEPLVGKMEKGSQEFSHIRFHHAANTDTSSSGASSDTQSSISNSNSKPSSNGSSQGS